jgi:hypothetical protein
MDNREAFEQYLKNYGYHQNSFSKKEAGGIVEYVDTRIDLLWQAWQACTAHHEAERNALLAVIEAKNEALKIGYERTKYNFDDEQDCKIFSSALSLTPNNVRLVEVSTVTAVAKGEKIWLVVSDTSQEPLNVNRGTKLYTIEKGE